MKNDFKNDTFVYAVLAFIIAIIWVVIFNNITLGIVFTAISAITMFFAILQKKQEDNRYRKKCEK